MASGHAATTSDGTTVAVMQPYLLPYLGYFQLVRAADVFVFYDDVQWIKGGWINRNRLLVDGAPWRFTVPCVGASSNRRIDEVGLGADRRWWSKWLRTVEQAYASAPHRDEVLHLVSGWTRGDHHGIADLAIATVTDVAAHLELATTFRRSSVDHPDRSLDRTERLIAITRSEGGSTYVNPTGGRALYDRGAFAGAGVDLRWLEADLPPYRHGLTPFVPGLSILDVLMWNDRAAVREMLDAAALT